VQTHQGVVVVEGLAKQPALALPEVVVAQIEMCQRMICLQRSAQRLGYERPGSVSQCVEGKVNGFQTAIALQGAT
jgi:hypothetical protein